MALIGSTEEKKIVTTATTTAASSSAATATATPTATTNTAPSATQIANDFSVFDTSNYKDEKDDSKNITQDDVSSALNKIVNYELSEKGKENTLFYSDNYNFGFTHNGKVVNGSCTEGGMKKAIIGGSEYITVTNADGETKSGVEAMADSYDSVLDLYTQSQFQKVLEKYGSGTFTNNCNFLKHVDEIRDEFGIDIKVIETQNADGSKAVAGVQNRTFEISLIDKEGNIIEDEQGNKSTILFGDWVIPDGTAQGAEFDFISVIDQAGYDCISKADFMNNEAFASNPEFQDANGNYDAGKAYEYVLGQIETEINNLKSGKGSNLVKASEQTIAEATYVGSTFTWWSAGGSGQYYENSGLDASLKGGVSSDLEKAFDLDGDGILSEEEQANMEQSVANEKEANGAKDEANAKKAQVQQNAAQATTGASVDMAQLYTDAEKEFEARLEEEQRENPETSEEEIAKEIAKEFGVDEDKLLYNYKH